MRWHGRALLALGLCLAAGAALAQGLGFGLGIDDQRITKGTGTTVVIPSNCLLINGTTTNCLLVAGTTTNILLVK